MRRTFAAVVVVAGLAGCAGTTGSGAGPGSGSADPSAAFTERATAIAQAWHANAATAAWRTGFVPLDDLTVPPPTGFPDDAGKTAFGAGWFVLQTTLPQTAPGSGTVRFPDGSTLSVPLVGARDAYGALRKGEPPCPTGTPAVPPASPGTPPAGPGTPPAGPDQSTSTAAPHTCAVLTVTGVALGSTRLRTSRGQADVPAWLFRIAGLAEPVARVAVALSAVQPVPTPSLPAAPPIAGLVSAQDIASIDGARLVYRLGVGACDYDIRPLIYETPDAVVVAGAVRTRPGACIDLLKLEPVTVTLAQPVGARPVLDGGTGRALTVR